MRLPIRNWGTEPGKEVKTVNKAALRRIVLNCFEQAGIVLEPSQEDYDLTEYIESSAQFISSLVTIEDVLDIEIPDAFLAVENIRSFHSFCELLYDLIHEKDGDWNAGDPWERE